MYSTAIFVFWVTLILYIITLCTVSYVGVYLTYVAIPLIVISGIIMKITKPKVSNKNASGTIIEIFKTTSNFCNEASKELDSINHSLEKFNEKISLITEKTETLKNKRSKLKIEKRGSEIKLKYGKDKKEIDSNKQLLKTIDEKIKAVDSEIDEVKKQCELEVEKKYAISD